MTSKKKSRFAIEKHEGWAGFMQRCTFCRAASAEKYRCRDGNNWFLCRACARKSQRPQ